jgi:hypothetical protein
MGDSVKIASGISVLTSVFVLTAADMPFYSLLGVTLFVFFGFKFFLELGKTIEIRDLIITIALLQWIIGPVLKYNFSPDDIFYYMAVPEETYIAFAFPASLFFIVGMYFPGLYKKMDAGYHIKKVHQLLKEYPNIDLILVGGGVIAAIAEDFVPVAVKFFVFLLGGARFIGLFFLVLSSRKFKWQIFAAVLFWLFIDTLRHAIFHELLLWLVFLFIILAFLYQFRTKQKLLFLVPIIILAILIQSLKFYFRAEFGQYAGSFDKAGLFTEMVTKELQTGEKTLSSSNFDAAIDRINQGWIVARIMRYTPYYEPFAEGETILTGIEASLVPRFLNPNKPKAGGRDNFERFTGKKISDNTSMGLSPLGEAYANFGVNGGIFFMFMLGLFYNFYMFMIFRLSSKYPSLILWLPLLFLQVVKAETDFVVVLNHLVKASMVVAMIIFSIRKFALIKI